MVLYLEVTGSLQDRAPGQSPGASSAFFRIRTQGMSSNMVLSSRLEAYPFRMSPRKWKLARLNVDLEDG